MKPHTSPTHIKLTKTLAALALFAFALCGAFVVLSDTRSLTFEPESLISFDRNGELLSFFVNERENFKVSIDMERHDLPEQLTRFVLLYEDKRFFTHSGVDLLALARAIWGNLAHAKRHGASTITMQVTKLGNQEKRTWWNKLTQTLQALRLEWQQPKSQILRLYLDNAPYGSNIIGVKSAALLYFKRPLHSLSPAQNALLAIMPNTPNLIFTNPARLQAKRDLLLKRALDSGIISDMEYRLALLEPLPRLRKSNSIAPHATLWLSHQNLNTQNLHAQNLNAKKLNSKKLNSKVFYTTLHKPTQELLESKLLEYATIFGDKGVHNLAALVLDSRDGSIVSYVGSQDFYDRAHLGAIDGVQARRNVGSTLKPFLYALALDSGLIIPQSMLPDSNQFYGNFNPHNASRRFYGSKSALFCLRNSLNAPFVALLQDYGVEEFFYFLRAHAPFSERDFSRYGLSLILGTKELSLFQLATLYLGLRRGGDFSITPSALARDLAESSVDSSSLDSSLPESKPESSGLDSTATKPHSPESSGLDSASASAPNLAQDYIDKSKHANFALSKEAAYLTLQALLNLPLNARSSRFAHKIAWKSGTSFGNRDSWAIGVSDRYVVAVWGGNFDAKSSINLTGREIAGVVMFDIFELLGAGASGNAGRSGSSGSGSGEFGSWERVGSWSNAPKMREVWIDKSGYRVANLASVKTQESSPIARLPESSTPESSALQDFASALDSPSAPQSPKSLNSTPPDSRVALDSPIKRAYMPYYAKPLRTAQAIPRPSSIIAYPTAGLRFSRALLAKRNKAPSDDNTQDGIIALLQQKSLAYFFLNGEFIGANDLGRMRLVPKNGANSLYVITQDGESGSVAFEVLE